MTLETCLLIEKKLFLSISKQGNTKGCCLDHSRCYGWSHQRLYAHSSSRLLRTSSAVSRLLPHFSRLKKYIYNVMQPPLGGALTERCHERKKEDWSTMEMPTLGLFVCMVWFQKLCRKKQNKNVKEKTKQPDECIYACKTCTSTQSAADGKEQNGKMKICTLNTWESRRVIMMTVRVFSCDPNGILPLVHFTAVHLLYSALISQCAKR